MSNSEAINTVNQLLNQIDGNVEVIPFNDIKKFVTLLEFIKGAPLEKEEIAIAKEMVTSDSQ